MSTTGPTNPAVPCPECAGPWLYNVVWQHVPGGCSLLTQLDATQAADYNRFTRSRPATSAELTLCAALGAELSGGVLAVIYSRPPVWLRRFSDARGTFDPDLIT
jgi:hypothetical protein